MATKKKAEAQTVTENVAVAAEETTAKKARTFPLKRLQKDCLRLFGVTSSTFAGATYDLADGDYTVEEIKTHIDNWKKKEVK